MNKYELSVFLTKLKLHLENWKGRISKFIKTIIICQAFYKIVYPIILSIFFLFEINIYYQILRLAIL